MKKKRTTRVTMRATKPMLELTKPPKLGSRIVIFRCNAGPVQLKRKRRQRMTSNSHCSQLLMKTILIMLPRALLDNNKRCPLSYSSKSLLRLVKGRLAVLLPALSMSWEKKTYKKFLKTSSSMQPGYHTAISVNSVNWIRTNNCRLNESTTSEITKKTLEWL